MASLEAGRPVRLAGLTDQEKEAISSLMLLSMKPVSINFIILLLLIICYCYYDWTNIFESQHYVNCITFIK